MRRDRINAGLSRWQLAESSLNEVTRSRRVRQLFGINRVRSRLGADI